MYNNPYMQNAYNPQANIERINAQMAELEKMKQQLQQPMPQPSINQTFQLSSINNNIKYANNIDEVIKETVFNETPFFSKDMSVVWLKNTKGEIKTYELEEIIPKDEKDIQIQYLQSQIEELKGMINNEQPITNANAEQNATNTTTNDGSIGKTVKKVKPSSV